MLSKYDLWYSENGLMEIHFVNKVDPAGFEPTTSALQGQRSTAELWAHYNYDFIFENIFFKK